MSDSWVIRGGELGKTLTMMTLDCFKTNRKHLVKIKGVHVTQCCCYIIEPFPIEKPTAVDISVFKHLSTSPGHPHPLVVGALLPEVQTGPDINLVSSSVSAILCSHRLPLSSSLQTHL